MNTNSKTYQNLSREQLISKCKTLFNGILKYSPNDEVAKKLITTQYDYIGLENMTIEQLRVHHTTLYNNYHSL